MVNKPLRKQHIFTRDTIPPKGFKLNIIEIEKSLYSLGYSVTVDGFLNTADKKAFIQFKKDQRIPNNCFSPGEFMEIKKALNIPDHKFFNH